MKIMKYEFDNVYYSDLDNPTNTIKNFEKFLKQVVKNDILYIKLIFDENKIVEVKCVENIGSNDLKEFLFIKSDLAGVGINNFFIEVDDKKNLCEKIQEFFKNLDSKDYYADNWVEKLLSFPHIKRIFKTDCDGDVMVIYQK